MFVRYNMPNVSLLLFISYLHLEGFSHAKMDSVALKSNCTDLQADLELHCLHIEYYPACKGVKHLSKTYKTQQKPKYLQRFDCTRRETLISFSY